MAQIDYRDSYTPIKDAIKIVDVYFILFTIFENVFILYTSILLVRFVQ